MTDKSLPPLLLKASQSYLEDALHKGVGKAAMLLLIVFP